MEDDFDNCPDDIFSLTDSGESSDSSSNHEPFDARTPLVLQMHELTRDKPTPENRIQSPTSAPESNVKVKKLKKKIRSKPANERHSVSSSSSETSISNDAAEEMSKEKLYNANENKHVSEHKPANPVTSAALVIAHSVHEQNPKGPTPAIKDQTEPTQTTLPTPEDTRRQSSVTITKPVTQPK